MSVEDLGGKGPELNVPAVEKYLQEVTLGYAAPDGRKFASVVRYLLGELKKTGDRVRQLEEVLAKEPGGD